MKCETCRYAIRDYTEYYGGGRQYYVDGCRNQEATIVENDDGEVIECDR